MVSVVFGADEFLHRPLLIAVTRHPSPLHRESARIIDRKRTSVPLFPPYRRLGVRPSDSRDLPAFGDEELLGVGRTVISHEAGCSTKPEVSDPFWVTRLGLGSRAGMGPIGLASRASC